MATKADPLDGYVTRREAGRTGMIRRHGRWRRRFLRRRVAQDLRWISSDPLIVL
jgi:hypothetical protein